MYSMMPKSWHFVSHGEMWVPMPGDAACVWLSDTHEQVNLLVVESGENAALVGCGDYRFR